MSQPLVTIITPTFNRPAMFAECAAAVLAQSFTDWVWWVVFNAWEWPDYWPPYRSVGIEPRSIPCRAIWNDPRVNLIWYPVLEETRAMCHVPARIVNWLYPKVTTPYIYFLADDDLIDSDGLGALVAAMNPGPYYKTPGSDYWTEAVYGRCEVVDQRPDSTYQHGCWTYPGENDGVVGGIIHPSTTMGGCGDWDVGLGTGIDPHCRLDGGQVLHTADLWRKATADGWQLTDSKDAGANDGVLLHRLAEFARFHYVPTKIVTHRRHAGATHHKPQVTP